MRKNRNAVSKFKTPFRCVFLKSVNWSAFLLGIFVLSCTANLQQTSAAKIEAAGIVQVCSNARINGCSFLGTGYEKFAANDKIAARAHIGVMLSQNPNLDVHTLTTRIKQAASDAGATSVAIKRFPGFILNVARKNTKTQPSGAVATHTPTSTSATSRHLGNRKPSIASDIVSAKCAFDVQCKSDRVCVDGECISPKYAAAIEAKYMQRKNIVAEAGPSTPTLPPVELLLPPIETETMLCTPKKVSACMKKCEQGNKESCYAVAKVYENLPPAARRTEYILYAYHKACDARMSKACLQLGRLYYDGVFVPQQLYKTFYNNVEACKLNNGIGCANAAMLQENGVGVVKDAKAAEQYYAMACTLGHDASCAKVETDQPIQIAPSK